MASVVPAECQGMQGICKCPGLTLPWSNRRSVSSMDVGQQMVASAAEQRLKEAGYLAWNARIVWVVIHGAIVGVLLIFDTTLRRALREGNHWYAGAYGALLLVTIVQYGATSGSSPGYVQEIEEVVEANEEEAIAQQASGNPTYGTNGTVDHPSASSGSVLTSSHSSVDIPHHHPSNMTASASDSKLVKQPSLAERLVDFVRWHDQRQIVRSNSALLRRTDSNRRCPYCQVWQPMRTKHCHDCDKCVLRFDHHCFWVGTCIGQRNHRKFWWYLFFEAVLSCWTFVISTSAFSWQQKVNYLLLENLLVLFLIVPLFVVSAFLIVLLGFHTYLVVTNQTTYETTRRKRIPYLRVDRVLYHIACRRSRRALVKALHLRSQDGFHS